MKTVRLAYFHTALLIALLAFGGLISTSLSTYVSAQGTQEPLKIIALGDSIVAGVGASNDSTFVARLSQRTGIQIENQGISGDSTGEALARLDASVLSKNPDIVLVFLGGNDILDLRPKEELFANLRTIIQRLKAADVTVILMGIHGRVFNVDYETGYEQIADDFDVYYVPNVLQDILGNPRYLSDTVHPNNDGHKIIADRVFPVLQDAIYERDVALELTVHCAPEETLAMANEVVVWNAFAYGGSGTYVYTWHGTDGLSGSGQTVSKQYPTAGQKTASTTVSTGGESASADCANTVTVVDEPLSGFCSVEVLPPALGATTERTIKWSVKPYGGNGQYTINWAGTDSLNGTATDIEHTYSSPGLKVAVATIQSGSRSAEISCSANVLEAVNTASPLGGSCSFIGDPVINNAVTWEAGCRGGTGTCLFSWSGDTTGNQALSNANYANPGRATGVVSISSGLENLTLSCQAIIESSLPINGRPRSGGCFIATAAFGTEMEPQIDVLRHYRDTQLETTEAGNFFVQTYYKYSPAIADYIAEHGTLRAITRAILKPTVELLK